MTASADIARNVKFDRIRYAQCWEDADVLLAGLDAGPGDTCLSIASAGDNTLAIAGAGVERVIAVDLSPAQIACLELRIAAYRALEHAEFLAFAGQDECRDRHQLYRRCARLLSTSCRAFWDHRPAMIRQGFAQVGRFERFLRVFRQAVLPITQGKANVQTLFSLRTTAERRAFYDRCWNNRRWRALGSLVFGTASLGRFGRDPGFTRYADEPVWNSLERRIPQALVDQVPAANPYLQWILKGRFETALPWAWRAENYDRIRANLDAIEWYCEPLEDVLRTLPAGSLDGCNLSDVFEYLPKSAYEELLEEIVRASAPGCRLVYWNVVVERRRPAAFGGLLKPLKALSASLHSADKAFFYRDLVIEEVI